jgi:hypothetical protein
LHAVAGAIAPFDEARILVRPHGDRYVATRQGKVLTDQAVLRLHGELTRARRHLLLAAQRTAGALRAFNRSGDATELSRARSLRRGVSNVRSEARPVRDAADVLLAVAAQRTQARLAGTAKPSVLAPVVSTTHRGQVTLREAILPSTGSASEGPHAIQQRVWQQGYAPAPAEGPNAGVHPPEPSR